MTSDTAPASLPAPAAWLGYGGALPFVSLAALCWLLPAHAGFWFGLLLVYGAVILSFVGALHWGFAMTLPQLDAARRSRMMAWSVVPALLAWPAGLLPAAPGVATLLLGYLLHYLQDQRLCRDVDLPSWYLPLRLHLSLAAGISLLAGVLAIQA
jgi:hypothetical protein